MANLKPYVGCPESNRREREKVTKQDLHLLSYNSLQIPGKKIGRNLYKRNMTTINEYINETRKVLSVKPVDLVSMWR